MSAGEALDRQIAALQMPPAGRLLAVLGDPIAHSLSPALHNAAIDHYGLPHRYVALRCRADDLPDLLDRARRRPVLGFSLTAPLKEAALSLVDTLDPVAAAVGSVNTVVFRDGRAFGTTTDGEGFLAALAADTGFRPAGRRAVVLGAGGAARAVVAALLDAGSREVTVLARTPERGAGLVADLSPLAPEAHLTSLWPPEEAPTRAELIVQATTVGLDVSAGAAGWEAAAAFFSRLPWKAWGAGAVAVDLNYRPERTAFRVAAASAGCTDAGGLGMLVHQAAAAFERWTGRAAPVSVMRGAVEERA